MRIAFLVSTFPVLSETFVLNQITGLIDRGHEVDIFANNMGSADTVHADVVKYNLLDHTHCPPHMPKNLLLLLFKGMLLIANNLHKNPTALLRSLNIFKYGNQSASLRLMFLAIPWLSKKYDIVHCHFGFCGAQAAMLRDIWSFNPKIVTTFHATDITTYLTANGNHIYDSLFKKGELFLPISNLWKNKLIELGCDERKIVVHHMGIDCTDISFQPRHQSPGDKIKILTVARLVEKKGVEYGIRAVASLANQHENIEYTIIGDGPLKDDLNALISDLGMEHCIHLRGWKKQSEILESLTNASILLLPSVTAENGDKEGIPVALMEAMASGLPVITTYHSGIPELVQDGVTGLLVPERDVNAITEKLSHMIDHPDAWPKMAKAGRDFVEERFNIDKLNDTLVELFKWLLRDDG